MFITKKKLEELIQQRLAEKEQQDYFFRRIGEVERELHQRIDNLSQAVYRLENPPVPNDQPKTNGPVVVTR